MKNSEKERKPVSKRIDNYTAYFYSELFEIIGDFMPKKDLSNEVFEKLEELVDEIDKCYQPLKCDEVEGSYLVQYGYNLIDKDNNKE